MNNFRARSDQNPRIQLDLDQNEANDAVYDEEETYNIKSDTNNSRNNSTQNRPSLPVTQAPSRNQYVPNSNVNNLNYNQKDMDLNNYDRRQQQQYAQPKSGRPQQQQPQYQFDNKTPLYVPPFLLNNIRPSRRNQHNAPKDYLPWSIANIFICVIIALPALFFSVQTRDMKRSGNVKKAKSNSKKSLILNIVASVVGLLTILTAVILRFALYQLFVNNDVQSQNVPIYIAGG